MTRGIGLSASALDGDLDRLYAERLLECVRESSLDAVVLLAQERPYEETGRLMEDRGTSYVPNEFVLNLARAHPEFLPAAAIHPARADALEELERALAGGAVMMKCLPNCQNIDTRLPRYRRFWERMADAGLPLLAHTGGENVLEVVRPDLADPRTLTGALECGVTVIAAHVGGRSGPFDPCYAHHLPNLFERYPNLYTDISALNLPFRARLFRRCLEAPFRDRLVHGSDFPVPVLGIFAWLHRLVSWRTYLESRRERNPLERDYRLKQAMGFPRETFTRVNRLLRA